MSLLRTLLAASLLLPSFALAEPPDLGKADKLVAGRQWDELFLAYAAVKADELGKPARGKLATALEAGARGAQADKDAALALPLAEKAYELAPTTPRALLVASIALALEQRAVAAAALDAGLKAAPKDAKLLFQRAKLHEADGEWEPAAALYAKVPGKGADGAEAKAGLARAKAAIEDEARGVAVLTGAAGKSAAPGSTPEPEGSLVGEESRVVPVGGGRGRLAAEDPFGAADDPSRGRAGGMRERSSRHFRIVYSDKGDFGRRAEYEYRVLEALERARDYVCPRLGHCPSETLEVVLYTKEEFELHFGGSSLGQALGFFAGKIRINNAEEISERVEYTLVHEFVHAAIADAVRPARLPTWLDEGIAEYIERQREGLDGELNSQERSATKAAGRALPTLAELENTSYANLGDSRRIAFAYFVGATAARLLDERKRGAFAELFEAIKDGAPAGAAIQGVYGISLERLQKDVFDELSGG